MSKRLNRAVGPRVSEAEATLFFGVVGAEPLRGRQTRQRKLNHTQTRNIILNNQRQIILQIHLDLATQIRTFNKIA